MEHNSHSVSKFSTHELPPQPINSTDTSFQGQEDIRRNFFQNATTTLMQLYKESLKVGEESYQQGKEDAYEEILKWFLSQGSSDFKYVSPNDFFNHINQKLLELRSGRYRRKSTHMTKQEQ